MAGEPETTAAIEGLPADLPPPGPPPASETVEPLTYEIASGLRCPVCQGLSVADSPSPTAVAMKDRVRELVVAGYTEEQIEDYFIARYGEWVLLSPPKQGLAWLLWLGPAVLLGLVLAWATAVATSWRREPDAVPLPSDVGLVPKDPYEEQLLRELEDDAP
ncbi:MAG: cytochrome c-type biogenesis protein CcmH [Deltaproteobacteria bacterium]|nr:cytochrome c-type biogenesis protein CcmH [Deltaproteobacteria bacterium]